MRFRQNSSVPSWARISNSPAFWFFVLFLIPSGVSAQVVISEVMYDASGSDAKAEWIELQNPGPTATDISKWKINDDTNHVLNAPPKNGSTGSLVMQPGTFLILASDATIFKASHPGMDASVIDTVIDLPNAGGTLSLLDASSSVVDSVTYTSASGGDGTGESLQKIGGAFVAAQPTPGAANSSERMPQPVAQKATTSKTPAKAAKKTSTSASAAAAIDKASVGSDPVEDDPATSSPVVPQASGSNTVSPWMFGAVAIGVAGSAAAVVARKKKQGEWDIEEIPDDV